MDFIEIQELLDKRKYADIIHILEGVTEWDDQSIALFQCMKIIIGELEHAEEKCNLVRFKEVDKIIQQYYIVKTLIRRFEFELDDVAQEEAFIYLTNTCVSTTMIDILLDTTTFYKKTLANNFLNTAKRVLDNNRNINFNHDVANSLYNHVSVACENFKDVQYE